MTEVYFYNKVFHALRLHQDNVAFKYFKYSLNCC